MTHSHPLQAYRAKASLTEDQLAAQLGVAGLTVKRWEAGEVLPQGRWREKVRLMTGVRFSDFVAFVEAKQEDAA